MVINHPPFLLPSPSPRKAIDIPPFNVPSNQSLLGIDTAQIMSGQYPRSMLQNMEKLRKWHPVLTLTLTETLSKSILQYFTLTVKKTFTFIKTLTLTEIFRLAETVTLPGTYKVSSSINIDRNFNRTIDINRNINIDKNTVVVF